MSMRFMLPFVPMRWTLLKKPVFFVDATANAVLKIKDFYKVKKNWQGDPCVPANLAWEGVGCRYDDSESPRIESL